MDMWCILRWKGNISQSCVFLFRVFASYSLKRGMSGIERNVICGGCLREHLISRTLSTYVTSVSFRAATSVVINHAARAAADTVRRLAVWLAGRARSHVRVRATRSLRRETGGKREKIGDPIRVFSSCAKHRAKCPKAPFIILDGSQRR